MMKDPLLQKLKRKAQKAKGEYLIRSGKVIKGGIAKAKGELNERIADAKIKTRNTKQNIVDYIDDEQ